MTNEGEVYFALYGDDFDPELITEATGLMPTSTKRKSHPRPKHTKWAVSCGKIAADVIDVYEMSSRLVGQLKPHTAQLLEVKNRLGLKAVLQVVLWITMDESKSTPAIGFEPEVIEFLNAVGASIDVDTYRNAV